MEKPNIKDYGIAVYIPFSKQKRRYNKEYEDYELSKLEKSEQQIYKIRRAQLANINGLSALLIAVITTLWGFYYSYPQTVQNSLSFARLGLGQTPSWADHIFLFLIPAVSGATLHNAPKILPGTKLKTISNLVIKCIPVLLLIIVWYIPRTQKQVKAIKRTYKLESVIFDKKEQKLEC